jgi:hypothetical protein
VFRVFLVRRSWQGGEEGRGTQVTTRRELGCGRHAGALVPPRVEFSPSRRLAQMGVTEDGGALVSEVHVLEGVHRELMEADLVDIGRLKAGDESYIEIIGDAREGDAPDRPARRFGFVGQPTREMTGIGWVLRLRAQEASAPFGNAQLGPDGGTP